MFDSIARGYDTANRLLTFGMDLGWRRKMLQSLPEGNGLAALDIATGTGDVPILMAQEQPRITRIHGLDLARDMLAKAGEKIRAAGLEEKIELRHGDAMGLPFPPGTFDLVTTAFGIRNIPAVNKALMEIFRVLKPGGRVLILESSVPENILMKAGYIVYLRAFMPLIGWAVSGNYKAYRYLNQTTERFPCGERFCRILKQTGFLNPKARPLCGGAATIYSADKP
ncbi:MAG: bifunctional demethylmenaquinone methyltransferase/2-methoxy-6-polyprenyl-1,4-benzoquinol methylase UbiE [Candidatus Omnitrophota bacterium]|nr:bifunctional demethylmenaquinone methyltransferase/2-methoxy-6-polyprenyl-1,4-benzoquinol methylase UbiE [Candidatus Omnitrophota bacterium]